MKQTGVRLTQKPNKPNMTNNQKKDKKPKKFTGKPKAANKNSKIGKSYKQMMETHGAQYDSFIQALHDPFKYIAPHGSGTWRPSTVDSVKSVNVITTGSATALGYIQINPSYLLTNGTLKGIPGFYGSTITSGKFTATAAMTGWNTGHLYSSYRLAAIGYRIRFLGAELDRGGRIAVCQVPRDIDVANAWLDYTDVAKRNNSKEFMIVGDEEYVLQGYVLPLSKRESENWINSTIEDGYAKTVAGWGTTLIVIESAKVSTRFEVEIVANYEMVQTNYDAGDAMDMNDVGSTLHAHPECPTYSIVHTLRGKEASANTHDDHVKQHGFLSKIANYAKSAGSYLLTHPQILENLSKFGQAGSVPIF